MKLSAHITKDASVRNVKFHAKKINVTASPQKVTTKNISMFIIRYFSEY